MRGRSIGHVGPALTASAATVMGGIGMMVFAKFGKFHDAGIAVTLGLSVSLCVVLTFTTSLLRLAGRWAFWPKKFAAAAPTHPRPGPGAIFAWFSWESLARRCCVARPDLVFYRAIDGPAGDRRHHQRRPSRLRFHPPPSG